MIANTFNFARPLKPLALSQVDSFEWLGEKCSANVVSPHIL